MRKSVEQLKKENEQLKWQVERWEHHEVKKATCCYENEKNVKMARKLSRLAQRSMASKDYPAVNLCLALLVELGTKKAADRIGRANRRAKK